MNDSGKRVTRTSFQSVIGAVLGSGLGLALIATYNAFAPTPLNDVQITALTALATALSVIITSTIQNGLEDNGIVKPMLKDRASRRRRSVEVEETPDNKQLQDAIIRLTETIVEMKEQNETIVKELQGVRSGTT